jgi:hypothetical protein
MKKINIFSLTALLFSLVIALDSCRVVGGIFKAGMWVGVLMVVGVVGLIIFLISKIGGR